MAAFNISRRKYNAIKRFSKISSYPRTFDDVLTSLSERIDLTAFSARSIAAMIDFGYYQNTKGYYKSIDEIL